MSYFRRPSPGLLLGILALVVAMTGSAVAASLITSKQIKDGTIQTKDISKKARAQLKGNIGPRGAAGPAGAAGAQGPAGPVNLKYVESASVDNPDGTQAQAIATCPATHPNVVGGGVRTTGYFEEAQDVNDSGPFDGSDADAIPDDGWHATADNYAGSDVVPPGVATDQITAFAICASATSIS